MLKKLGNKKGFTLAELLIVVAIIAILVAIAIPTFSAALQKAEHGRDLANVRAEYAEAVVNYLSEGTTTPQATITGVAKNSNVTFVSDKITVTHKDKAALTGSFDYDIKVVPDP